MIAGYKVKKTEQFALGRFVKAFSGFEVQATTRLAILDAATLRGDLAAMQSNRFEALGGSRKGQFSICINDQWRICFEWPDNTSDPFNVEITDYH